MTSAPTSLHALEIPLELPLEFPVDGLTLQKNKRSWLVRRALLIADGAALAVAFLVAELIFNQRAPGDRLSMQVEYLFFLLTIPCWVIAAKSYGLYDKDAERIDHSTVDDVSSLVHLVTVGTWVLFVVLKLLNLADPLLAKLALFWAAAIVLLAAARVTARTAARHSLAYLQNTVIVGAGEVGQLLARKLRRHPEYGLNLVGFVDDDPRELHADVRDIALLGTPERLPELIDLLDIERVVIAFTLDSHQEMLALVRRLKACDVQISLVPRLFELVAPSATLHSVEGIPMIGLPPLALSRSSLFLKRLLDLLVTVPMLVLLSPLIAAAAVAIRLESHGPVYFRQVRRGGDGATFRIWKFRTMVADAEARKHEVAHLNMHTGDDPRMFKIADDPRVTRVGSFLRKHKLDELPQLFNVLSGEMSLVGPRPLILEEDQYVDDWGRRRLDLKPGMTGLWQVLGGSDIAFEEMLRLDYLYVTTWSPARDLGLLFRTVPVVMRGRGSY